MSALTYWTRITQKVVLVFIFVIILHFSYNLALYLQFPVWNSEPDQATIICNLDLNFVIWQQKLYHSYFIEWNIFVCFSHFFENQNILTISKKFFFNNLFQFFYRNYLNIIHFQMNFLMFQVFHNCCCPILRISGFHLFHKYVKTRDSLSWLKMLCKYTRRLLWIWNLIGIEPLWKYNIIFGVALPHYIIILRAYNYWKPAHDSSFSC